MYRGIVFAMLFGLVLTGCGGGSGSQPTAPSPTAAVTPGGGSAMGGATISGTVNSGATTRSVMPMADGMTVQVVGTSISSPVGSGGAFSLTGVPAGSSGLRFLGTGVDATATLSPVSEGETVTLVVGVSGSTATIESETRSSNGQVELEGRIESLPPTQPANTLIVGGRTVTVGPDTVIRDGNGTRSFADLAIGLRVHVTGRVDGAALAAQTITIQNTNTTIPVNVNGTVDQLTGTSSSFRFFVGGREVRGDGNTQFFGDGDRPDQFSRLANGVRVEVKGQQRDNFVYAERIHINGSSAPTPTPPQEESASIEARLNTIGGTAPNLTLLVGTTTVRTSSSTEVRRRGDVQTLAALAIGQTLHVVGVRRSDGSIDARMIQIKEDESGGAFTIEGSMGGLKGSCPSLTFGVNGYSISTNGSTTFVNGACGDLRNGTRVLVEGTRQGDGSVKATSVTRR